MNGTLSGELVHVLYENINVRVERIFSFGTVTPDNFWYDQEDGELVFVENGNARIEFDDNGKRDVECLSEGEYLYIQPRRKHRVSYTSENCVWKNVFFKEK